VRENKK